MAIHGSTNSSPEPLEVWLVSDADDYRAMHDYILFEQGQERTLYECEGQPPGKPIAALLAATGFTSGASSAPVNVIVLPPEGIEYVKIRGFKVEAEKRGSLEFAVRVALQGNLGGFTSVLTGQVGFHRPVYAFEYLWAVAERPPVLVRHPEITCGQNGGIHGPGSIENSAATSRSIATSLVRAGKVLGALPGK